MKVDRLYLIHLKECLQRVENYTRQYDKDRFMVSPLIQDAVVRNLQVMAESTQRLSEKLKESHPEIDWFKIAGFRIFWCMTTWGRFRYRLAGDCQRYPWAKKSISDMLE